jgi:hypothetical protein
MKENTRMLIVAIVLIQLLLISPILMTRIFAFAVPEVFAFRIGLFTSIVIQTAIIVRLLKIHKNFMTPELEDLLFLTITFQPFLAWFLYIILLSSLAL